MLEKITPACAAQKARIYVAVNKSRYTTMNKFYGKQFAANVGHEATFKLALNGSVLAANIAAMNAIANKAPYAQ